MARKLEGLNRMARYGFVLKKMSPEFCRMMDSEKEKLKKGLKFRVKITDSEMSRVLAEKLKAINSKYKLKKRDKEWADVIVRVRL